MRFKKIKDVFINKQFNEDDVFDFSNPDLITKQSFDLIIKHNPRKFLEIPNRIIKKYADYDTYAYLVDYNSSFVRYIPTEMLDANLFNISLKSKKVDSIVIIKYFGSEYINDSNIKFILANLNNTSCFKQMQIMNSIRGYLNNLPSNLFKKDLFLYFYNSIDCIENYYIFEPFVNKTFFNKSICKNILKKFPESILLMPNEKIGQEDIDYSVQLNHDLLGVLYKQKKCDFVYVVECVTKDIDYLKSFSSYSLLDGEWDYLFSINSDVYEYLPTSCKSPQKARIACFNNFSMLLFVPEEQLSIKLVVDSFSNIKFSSDNLEYQEQCLKVNDVLNSILTADQLNDKKLLKIEEEMGFRKIEKTFFDDSLNKNVKIIQRGSEYDLIVDDKLEENKNSLNEYYLNKCVPNFDVIQNENDYYQIDKHVMRDIKINRDLFDGRIYYISDIHLDYKIHLIFGENPDTQKVDIYIKGLANRLYHSLDYKDYSDWIIFNGDTGDCFEYVSTFYREFSRLLKYGVEYDEYDDGSEEDNRKKNEHVIVILGNHELWDSDKNGNSNPKSNYESIVNKYKELANKCSFYFVQNSLLIFKRFDVDVIEESMLNYVDIDKLVDYCRDSVFTLYGGIGFSGLCKEYNATTGLYRNMIKTIEDDKKYTKRFSSFYNTLCDKFRDIKIIIASHTPINNWTDSDPIPGWIYFSGHTHENTYDLEGNVQVYSDNQIGYKRSNLFFKFIPLEIEYNYFSTYPDGIYEITRNDYELFYLGIRERIAFTREFSKLHMLKKDNNYLFLLENESGALYVLSGGTIRKNNCQSIDEYYNNLVEYSNSIKSFLLKYNEFQNELSTFVKRIGGSGKIHGCIIDIDFFNHIYINPLDKKITPYFALSIVDKYVYKNIASLLKNECPKLYLNYKKALKNSKNELIVGQLGIDVDSEVIAENSTEIYRLSRIIKGLQYTTRFGVVRLWDENYLKAKVEKRGELIVSSLINGGYSNNKKL